MSLRPATPLDCAPLATLHRACFADAWSAVSFHTLLSSPGVSALLAPSGTKPAGFILWRVAADEAEVLSLGVLPLARRRGLARALVLAAAAAAFENGSQSLFLEVAAGNRAALALYSGLGFAQAGLRPAYYKQPDGTVADALILKARLPLRYCMGNRREVE
jgi:ribosomal-protein-alanine N-acetyltransferase